jgi:hypothetical protein
MITTENITDFDEYLEENHRKNPQNDISNMSAVGRYFDPLVDQEPNTDRLAENNSGKLRNKSTIHEGPARKLVRDNETK